MGEEVITLRVPSESEWMHLKRVFIAAESQCGFFETKQNNIPKKIRVRNGNRPRVTRKSGMKNEKNKL